MPFAQFLVDWAWCLWALGQQGYLYAEFHSNDGVQE